MPNAIPEGYHSVTAYLALSDAGSAIEFYQRALGAVELYRLPMPNGKIGHAELQIGDSRVMLSDESPEWGNRSPKSLGGSPITLCIYTEDVDALARRFVEAGGETVRALANQFYGDRSGTFRDPEGYLWTLAQHIEDVAPEEMQRRMAEM
jgi:PhnB protein